MRPNEVDSVSSVPDRTSPVELLDDSPVTQYESAPAEQRGQTHDQRAEHVAAARRVLVRGEVPPSRVDVDGIEFRRDGIRVVRNEFALDLLQNASRFRVEVLDGESTFLGLELERVPHASVIPGLLPFAERGRFAVFQQWLQIRFFWSNAFLARMTSNLVRSLKTIVTGFSGTNFPSHEKRSSHAVKRQPQSLKCCLRF